MLVQVRKLGIGTLILLGVLFLVDLTFPPPLHKAQDFSDIITDREARWLHVFSNGDLELGWIKWMRLLLSD